ncbi:hypothetical protein AMTR_s00127p00049350 [Amborella trichopoda]|uniref:Uncharacterized protein n=1 Tax=Amborella trichopoda TaxID=13333 RepID=W1NRN3_AMBTC|nr:hypothetical protein AMTR_s00127p00049350 [Amborella trichopoda]
MATEPVIPMKITRSRKKIVASSNVPLPTPSVLSTKTDVASQPKKCAKIKATLSPIPVSEVSPTRSSLSQGDFFFATTEEGDIIAKEATEEEVVVLEAPAPVTSEVESQPNTSSSAGLELVEGAASEDSSLVPSAEGTLSEPVTLPSEPLALVPQETTIITKVPPLVSADPSHATSLASTRKASLVRNLLQSSLQRVKDCSLSNMAVEIGLVKDCATTMRLVHYDKESFDRFEGLLKNLEQWGNKGWQSESEVQAAYMTCLASAEETLTWLQSLIRGYEEKKGVLLSKQARLKQEDEMYSMEIAALEEERARLDADIHKIKTQRERERAQIQK